MLRSAILSVTVALSLTACLDSSDESQVPPGLSGSLEAALQPPRDFGVEPTLEVGGSVVKAEGTALQAGVTSSLDLRVMGGNITAKATTDGSLFLSDLTVDIDDLSVPATLVPPSGMELTAIQVRLAAPTALDAVWSADGTRVTSTEPLDLVLEWAARLDDGSLHPLGPLHLDNLPLLLEIEDTGSDLSARLLIDRQGAFWTWLETFELADLQADLRATLR